VELSGRLIHLARDVGKFPRLAYKGPQGITILEGLDPVRRRPAMYIGGEDVHPSLRLRLLEYAVSEIANERLQKLRVLLWSEDAVTLAYDGSLLPIEPSVLPPGGVPHPSSIRRHLTPMYGPAVRRKRFSSICRIPGSCINVSGLSLERLRSGPSWISARLRSH
jgi:hypothetical protein